MTSRLIPRPDGNGFDTVPVVFVANPTTGAAVPDITRGSGPIDANTQRVTLATDGPGVAALTSIDAKTPVLVSGAVPTVGTQKQLQPKADTAANYATQFSNFAGVDTANGDFATFVSGLNGQKILALSGNPLTTGESVLTCPIGVSNPGAMEIALSVVRPGISFATASLFANATGGPDAVPAPINIVSAYQCSVGSGAAYNAAAGSIATFVLDSPLPGVGTGQAVLMGDWINITGLIDNRLNYPNACISYISADRKTITVNASDEGSLPSLAVPVLTPTLGTAKANFYNNFNGARNAHGIRFTQVTTTSAAIGSIYGGDDNQISGALVGDHRTTISTSAPNYVSGAVMGSFELRASSRYRIEVTPSSSLLLDKPESSNNFWTMRDMRESVKPVPGAVLFPRLRLYKPVSMSRPICKIVSASKTGTTTATIVTDVPHGLVTGNYVTVKGMRNVTNFPALTAAALVTVVNATTIQVVIGAAVTATTYGGSVILCNGGRDQPGVLVGIVQSVQSRDTDGAMWLDVMQQTAALWAGVNAGDYINLHGVRSAIDGSDIGVDGVWEVANNASNGVLTVRPVFDVFGARVSPALGTLSLTNCGGTAILRPTLRSHDLMLESWTETRVKIDGQGQSRSDKAIPVMFPGATTVTAIQGTAVSAGTEGAGAWPVRNVMSRATDIGSAAITTSQTSSAIALGNNNGAMQFNCDVTAVTGTTPRMLFRVQGSYDNGASFVNIYDTGVITNTTKTNDTPVLPVDFTHVRYIRTVTGTTPSFTNSVTRVNRSGETVNRSRRMVDQVMSLTATTPSTEWLYVHGCLKAHITCTALTGAITAPVLKLQACTGDASVAGNWFDVAGATLTTNASNSTASAIFDLPHARFVRLVPTTAGVATPASTAYELAVSAWQ